MYSITVYMHVSTVLLYTYLRIYSITVCMHVYTELLYIRMYSNRVCGICEKRQKKLQIPKRFCRTNLWDKKKLTNLSLTPHRKFVRRSYKSKFG